MSNLLNLAESINKASLTGQTPTFIFNGSVYEFSPQGLIDFLTAESSFFTDLPFTIPTSDPGVAGEVWNDEGTLKVSAG